MGQGTWMMGEGWPSRVEEVDALRLAIDLGLTAKKLLEKSGAAITRGKVAGTLGEAEKIAGDGVVTRWPR